MEEIYCDSKLYYNRPLPWLQHMESGYINLIETWAIQPLFHKHKIHN